MFLVFAEDEAKERHIMTMHYWINATNNLLKSSMDEFYSKYLEENRTEE